MSINNSLELFYSVMDTDKLEEELKKVPTVAEKVILIDKLNSVYAYTDFQRAKELLDEQFELLKKYKRLELELNYHLNAAFIENQFYNYPLAESHLRKALSIIEEKGNNRKKVEILIDYAGICINLKRNDDALRFLEKAEGYLRPGGDPIMRSRIATRRGYIYMSFGEMDKYVRSAELFLSALSTCEKLEEHLTLKDYYFLTLIHSGLGLVFTRSKNLPKAIEHYQKVLEICQVTGMKTRLSYHYLNIGKCYLGTKGGVESARKYFKKAIQVKNMVRPKGQANAYGNLGYCYFLMGNYEDALEMYNRAEYLYKNKTEENFRHFATLENWKAMLYLAKKQNKLAKRHFEKAFKYAKKSKNYYQVSEVAESLAKLYAMEGNYESAYKFQTLHIDFSKYKNEDILNQKTLELELKNEVEKRERETRMLRLQATSLKLKALRAQMNPHFIYNALNSIQNYITSKEVNDAAKYLAKFSKLMRQILDYSDVEVISLEKEKEFLENYLHINKKLRFGDKFSYRITMDDDIEDDIIGVPTMIIQPYVENAIEHGLRTREHGLVTVNFQMETDFSLICTVQDNGIGRKKAREIKEKEKAYIKHVSKGTSITEERLRLIHNTKYIKNLFVKTYDLEDENTGEPLGTRVEIIMPVKDIIPNGKLF